MVELIILFPLFLLILFAIIEFSLIYRAKFTLNHAAQQVARAGSLNNACMGAMDEQLVRSMTPLYLKRDPDYLSFTKVQIVKREAIKIYTDVDVISPSLEIFNRFKEKIPLYPAQISDCASKSYRVKAFKPVDILPNDNLQFRSQNIKQIKVKGESIDINIQDANLLKVQVRFCHRLAFPVIDMILDAIQRSPPGFNTDSIFYNNCINGKATDLNSWQGGRFIVLSAYGIARMQTPIFKNSLKDQ